MYIDNLEVCGDGFKFTQSVHVGMVNLIFIPFNEILEISEVKPNIFVIEIIDGKCISVEIAYDVRLDNIEKLSLLD